MPNPVRSIVVLKTEVDADRTQRPYTIFLMFNGPLCGVEIARILRGFDVLGCGSLRTVVRKSNQPHIP